ncbi:hypothetical protein Gotri_026729 [Gossypium trilobum]|uniref:Uncharacterized protein n=1 Tax=Gossypium trilobum TaxID=34281 RepID=A0A7J9FSM2_9ROSI|nr:hypothetical protein [Gossypium trilobum]
MSERRSGGHLPTAWDPELIQSFTHLCTYESDGHRLEELKHATQFLFKSLTRPEEKLDMINKMQRLDVAKLLKQWVSEDVVRHIMGIRPSYSEAERVKRGIEADGSCGLCGYDYEDILHIKRDCPAAQDICTSKSSSTKVSNSTLVRRIQLFLAKMVHCSIHHVFIEYNKEADRLAKMTASRII